MTSLVRVCVTVTVAFAPGAFCMSIIAIGLPTILDLPTTTTSARYVRSGSHKEFLNAGRGAGQISGLPYHQFPNVYRMKSIDVLAGVNCQQHAVFVHVFGQRQLDQDPVDFRVLVILVDELQQCFFAQIGGLAILDGIEPEFMSGILLRSDITLRGRVLVDEDGDQARYNPVLFVVAPGPRL